MSESLIPTIISESPVSTGISESPMATGAGADLRDAVVVLESVWWKNPFLWMLLVIGIPMTILSRGMGGAEPGLPLLLGLGTILSAVAAHIALLARLEIRPDGFRESSIWRTIEYRWADVTPFHVRTEPEAEPAVGFSVRKDGTYGKSRILESTERRKGRPRDEAGPSAFHHPPALPSFTDGR